MMEEKVLSLGKFSVVATRGLRSLAPSFWFAKYTFFGTSLTTRKPTMMQKGIIIFNPIYLTKVKKLLNTKRLVIQVSNTRFNIQSLHF